MGKPKKIKSIKRATPKKKHSSRDDIYNEQVCRPLQNKTVSKTEYRDHQLSRQQNALVLWLALAIFSLALVLRLIYFSHLQSNPYFSHVDAAQGLDQQGFWETATSIVEHGPIGNKPFYQAPLYAYFMAGIFKVFGPSIPTVRLVQLIMGAAACVLVFWIGRQVFGLKVAIIAGFIGALYPVSIFYEGLLLRAAFAAQMNLVLLSVLLLAFQRRSSLWWVLSGVCFGLCILIRPNIALFGPFLLVWIWLALKKEAASNHMRATAWVIFGTMLVLMLLIGRNLAAGVAPLSLSRQGAYVFYLGNAIDAQGVGYSIPQSYKDAPKDRLVSTAIAGAMENPGAYLKLQGRKLLMLFNGFESPNNMNFYLLQEFSWVLRNPVLSFTVLAPLGILGLVLSFHRSKQSLLLNLFFLAGLLSMMLFYIISRLRYPIVPFFMILASYTLYWFYEHLRCRKYKDIAIAATLGVFLLIVSVPRVPTYGYIRPEDLFNLGLAYMQKKQYEQARVSFQRVLLMTPQAKPALSNYFFCKAMEYMKKKQYDMATEAFRQVLEATPDSVTAQQNYFFSLGLSNRQNKRYEQAAAAFRRVLKISPDMIAARQNLDYCENKMLPKNKQ